MDAWSCESCGALIKQKKMPSSCLLCNRRGPFTHVYLSDSHDDASKNYENALHKLEEYEKGVPKRKLSDYSRNCNC